MNNNKKKVAMLASLDTKYKETMYARDVIEKSNCQAVVIDMSARFKDNEGADIGPEKILEYSNITWESFDKLNKSERIETMSNALSYASPILYESGVFDAIISIGGGQNARMAAAAMKQLPFGVPKIVASSLACGKRTLEQYVGDKDIFVLHTVADISSLNNITKTIINNVCNAVTGMVNQKATIKETKKIKVAATMLGITTKGVEGVLKKLPDDKFEKTCFHANGVGGRCMEKMIREGSFDLILDMTLHEITGEIIGGYCQGANNRLKAAIETKTPMLVVPGALDMLDFFIDEEGKGLPDDIEKRKKVYHNSSICHTKIYVEEAKKLADTLAMRLNMAESPVTLIVPNQGFCEAAAPAGPMYDPEVDKAFIEQMKKKLNENIEMIVVDGNINDEICQNAVLEALNKIIYKIKRSSL